MKGKLWKHLFCGLDVLPSQASSETTTLRDDGCTTGPAVSCFNYFVVSINTDNVMDCLNNEGILVVLFTQIKKQDVKY